MNEFEPVDSDIELLRAALSPPGWKGEWVQMAGSSSGPGYSIYETAAPGTWVLVYGDAVNPAS